MGGSFFFPFCLPVLLILSLLSSARAVEAPRLVQKDGRYALLVEGRPYLILGGQIHNSSGWPSELPRRSGAVGARVIPPQSRYRM